jgi:hypothetical protein
MLRGRFDQGAGGRRAWALALLPLALPRKAAGGAVSVLAASGGVVMNAKAKATLGLLVVGLLGTGLLVERALRSATSGDETARAQRPVATVEASAEVEGGGLDLPQPVNLDAVDRDRDLHGTVVRRVDGAPIGGAEVRVVSYPWRRTRVINYDGHHEAIEGPCAVTARDGTFSLRLRPGADVALRVSAKGYAALELEKRQAGERVRIEMAPGVRLTVITRDERGLPVSGTRLRLWCAAADALTVRGVTDASGRCALGPLPGMAVYAMDVEPERLGYPGWEFVQLPEAGAHEHVVTLSEGRRLSGRVTDAATGAPIASARIGMNWVMSPSVTTDAQGRYSLSGWLGRGVEDIHCVADGYGREHWVVDGEAHDFELSRGDSVTGRLLAAEGQAVAGAVVTAIGTVHRARQERICARAGLSDEEGRFLLSGLRRDLPHTLVVMADGHGRYLLDFDPHPEEPGTIDVGDVRLPAARAIAGRVLSHSRQPLSRIEVFVTGYNSDRGRLRGVEPERSFYYGETESRRTDDLGRFRFPDLSPGSYTLTVHRSGMKGLKRPLTLVEGEDLAGIEVVMPEGREFTVTVVDEENTPVPGVVVSLDEGMNGQSDVRGRVTFFVTGKVERVTGRPASGRDLLQADSPVEGDADEFVLVLRRGTKIAGTVLDDQGQPVPNAWVAARLGGRQVASSRGGSDGRFSLDVPCEAAMDLEYLGLSTESGSIDRGDWRGRPLEGVAAGVTGVELRLRRVERDRSLRVRVLYRDGKRVV